MQLYPDRYVSMCVCVFATCISKGENWISVNLFILHKRVPSSTSSTPSLHATPPTYQPTNQPTASKPNSVYFNGIKRIEELFLLNLPSFYEKCVRVVEFMKMKIKLVPSGKHLFVPGFILPSPHLSIFTERCYKTD